MITWFNQRWQHIFVEEFKYIKKRYRSGIDQIYGRVRYGSEERIRDDNQMHIGKKKRKKKILTGFVPHW